MSDLKEGDEVQVDGCTATIAKVWKNARGIILIEVESKGRWKGSLFVDRVYDAEEIKPAPKQEEAN